MRRNLILAAGMAMAMAGSAWAASYPITTTQIAAAISSTGTAVEPAQVDMLTRVVAATSSPRLTIDSAETMGGRLIVRLSCEQSSECLPFLVAVRATPEAAARLAGLSANDGGLNRSSAPMASHEVVIRTGTPAVLLLDGKHVHIQIPVVTMENGSIGQRIRVTEKGSRQTYTAVVVNGGLLQGRL